MLGADSARTDVGAQNSIQYNYNQKLFEIGRHSNYGMVTWGKAALGHASFRTLIARLADSLPSLTNVPVKDVAAQWANLFHTEYHKDFTGPADVAVIAQCRSLLAAQQQGTLAPADAPVLADLTAKMNAVATGFCIGGVSAADHEPEAYSLVFSPIDTSVPVAAKLPCPTNQFWGAPNFLARLLKGADLGLKQKVLESGKWNGSPADFDNVLAPFELGVQAQLPLRDGIDWVFTAIYTNVKAYKFAHKPRICGGPVEIAVISSDRPFRWVMHKSLDHAIKDGLLWENPNA